MKKLLLLAAALVMSVGSVWADHATYKITSKRGTLFAYNNKLYGDNHAATAGQKTDANSQWLIFNEAGDFNGNGSYYFYNIDTQQFWSTNDGTFLNLSADAAVQHFVISSGDATNPYAISTTSTWAKVLNFSDWGNANDTGARFANNPSKDDGNRMSITQAETITDAEYATIRAKVIQAPPVEAGKFYRLKSYKAFENKTVNGENHTFGYMDATAIVKDGRKLAFNGYGPADATFSEIFTFESNGSDKYYLKAQGTYFGKLKDGDVGFATTQDDAALFTLTKAPNDGYYYLMDSKQSNANQKYAQLSDWWGFGVGGWRPGTAGSDDDLRCQWAIEEIETISVSLTTIGTSSYATLYAPYAVQLPSTVKAYTTTLNGTTLQCSEVAGGLVPAGTAVILVSETGDATAQLTLSNSTAEPLTTTLTGTYRSAESNGQYVFSSVGGQIGFYKLAEGVGLKANKAYYNYVAAPIVGEGNFTVELGETSAVVTPKEGISSYGFTTVTQYELDATEFNSAEEYVLSVLVPYDAITVVSGTQEIPYDEYVQFEDEHVYLYLRQVDENGDFIGEAQIVEFDIDGYYHLVSSDVKGFVLDFGNGEQTTGVSQLSTVNCQLSTAYDLAGRRVNASVKGISIVNGKKVIR